MEISPKVLKAAREAAQALSAKAQNAVLFRRCESNWPALAAYLGIEIPPTFTKAPYDIHSVRTFTSYYVATVAQRIEAEAGKDRTHKLTLAKQQETFGAITLLPEQQSVKNAIWEEFFIHKRRRIAMNDGETGSGKTFLIAGLVASIIKHNLDQPPLPPGFPALPYRIFIFAPKVVVEQHKRWLEAMNLGQYLGNRIIVAPYSAISSSFGKTLWREEVDAKGEPVMRIQMPPFFIAWDEFHRVNNPQTIQTQFAMAINDLPNQPYQLFLSATPFVTVNNTRTFVTATRAEYFGMQITRDTFPLFANQMALNGRPDKPNAAAAKRLRETLSDYIFSFPYVKWPHKAINQVLIVDFESPEHRRLYDQAYELYLERKRKAGQNTQFGKFEEFVALGQFRKAVEPYRAQALSERALDAIARGKAAVIGTAFRETVAQITYKLHQAGIPRSKISIIWGGKKEFREHLLLSDKDMQLILVQIAMGQTVSTYDLKRLDETVRYKTERIMAAETTDEQRQRHETMRELRLLGTQSAAQRQTEIDAFQSGESLVCIFTLAAGGVGLSLDQCNPNLRPRESYFTPVYSGPEAKQALGRTVRRTTCSDTYQYITYMRDTVEEYHVAPIMDEKLACIANFTKSAFNTIDLSKAEKSYHKYRTAEQAAADADSQDAQFHGHTDDSDIDEEDEDDDTNDK